MDAGRAMTLDAHAYLAAKEPYGPRYATWFGAPEPQRGQKVGANFAAIKDAFETRPLAIDCGCNEPYFAYVYPVQPYKIYVCEAFWSAAITGTDSRGGTLVHEMSHFDAVAGTDDHVYGQAGAAELARTALRGRSTMLIHMSILGKTRRSRRRASIAGFEMQACSD
ncbi:M35 family metallo-endopeptidase [Massilia sp. DD77]|uniref:M35 family metallo-endopeptidase n=1 Tax=Massilia sp. DD77 TaxID=3109349 RepID=UPI0030002C45